MRGNNIDIGNEGVTTDGVNANSGIIRIGNSSSQKETYIAGIENSKITGSAVYIAAAGRLGVLASSERYKTAIEPMGWNTAKLAQLRPVRFKLKTDTEGTVQYGLIAEEVDKVYPDLVIRDEGGKVPYEAGKRLEPEFSPVRSASLLILVGGTGI